MPHATAAGSRRCAIIGVAICLSLYLRLPMEVSAAGNLVAAYNFNEGSGTVLNDLSGNGNQGTLVNGPVWSTGKYGGALTFDGANDIVTINDANSLHLTTAMTLEAWVKSTTTSTGWRTVVLKEIPGNLVYALYGNMGTNRPGVQMTTTTAFDTRGTAQLPQNTWVHMAATYDGATLNFYLNGALVGSKAASGSLRASTNPLRIGGNLVWGEYFKGQIDDVRIYNGVLTQAQIQTDMNTPVVASLPDTTPPTASLTAPADGSEVAGPSVTVSATASDNVGVTGVQFQLDGVNLGAEDTASPYSLQWDTTRTTNGSHTITALARDLAGNQGASSPFSVTVDNIPDTTPPTVALSAPAGGSTVSSTIAVSATASDDVGVAGVQFLLDGDALGAEDTTPPYSTNWNTSTTTNGPHVLSAVARDGAGNTANAANVSVSVDNGAAGLTFDDEFNGTTVDTNKWFVMNRHGDYSNSELQCYTPSNVVEAGGLFTITTQVQTATCGDATHAPSTWNYTSGMIIWKTFNFTYGTIEMRAKMAGGQGPWPALWLLGKDCQVSFQTGSDNFGGCNWPNAGSDEIDITEILGALTNVNQAIHNNQGSYRCTATTSDVSRNWHVYDLVWSPGRLVWHIDGATTCTITTAVSTTPKFLIINTAVAAGGSHVDDSTLPQTMSIDYVRVSTSGTADTQLPTAPANFSAAISGGNVNLAWSPATDNVGVTQYNVYRSSVANFLQSSANKIGQTTSTNYTDTTASGTVYYKVTAQDSAGNIGAASNEASATLPIDTTSPVVSMTAPAEGSTVSGPVTVSAAASDDVRVVGVQFLLDGNNLGTEVTTAPYSLNWDSVTAANGPHALSARARDAAGNVATATAVNITVNNPVGTTTIDFNAHQANVNLNGQYPTGVVDWGTNVWWVASPWGQFTTNSISFNRAGITSGSFTFVSPKRLVSIKAYNGGTSATTITLTCAGNATVTQSVSVAQLVTISTGWTVACSTVMVGSSNGWDTNLDDVTYN
ncbi:MAG: hypothetical protein DMF87_06450 [Acidobacteria bacterium]|nr:MAG: hypothetical protein DMF87_06450 [Acidobacteriota bacterium]